LFAYHRRQADATGALGALAGLPTLVVSALHDPIAPPSAGRALAASIPGADYVEFDDASHGLPITHAREVNEIAVPAPARGAVRGVGHLAIVLPNDGTAGARPGL
jgi:pimeloyl-ACP methyl ester carboxylesterase